MLYLNESHKGRTRVIVGFFVVTCFFFSYVCIATVAASTKDAPSFTDDVAQVLNLSNGDKLQYLAYYPKGFDSGTLKKYPLVVALHGGISSDPSLLNVSGAGLAKRASAGEALPFVLIAPFNPHARKFWVERDIMELVDYFRAQGFVDSRRVHLTGYSRGAFGAWTIAMQNPGVFASLVAVCGATPEPYHVWIEPELPVWVFHGAKDTAIPLEESAEFVDRLKARGKEVKFTVYPELSHNAWDKAYADPQLVNWIMSQKRKTVSSK